MSDVEYPVGQAILAMILGIPGALLMGVFRWAGFVGSDAVLLAWMGSGLVLTLWITGLDS